MRFAAILLIVSGGIGNLFDRVFREGRVIDFMLIEVGSLRTGVFNVADVSITSGVIILLMASLRQAIKPRGST